MMTVKQQNNLVKQRSIIEALAGKYRGKATPVDDIDAAKESAMLKAQKQNYKKFAK